MNSKKSEIVPFGKYKGQPIEEMVADQSYCEWVMAQPWFKAKFGNVYNVIVNYGGEPADTPEHNEMQARFLEDAWCFKLLDALGLDYGGMEKAQAEAAKYQFNPLLAEHLKIAKYREKLTAREFEFKGWDVAFTVTLPWIKRWVVHPACSCPPFNHAECPTYSDCHSGADISSWSPCLGRYKNQTIIKTHYKSVSGYYESVSYAERIARGHSSIECPWSNAKYVEALFGPGEVEFGRRHDRYRILVECKPSMGEDYPTVLRQVLRHENSDGAKRCVVVRRCEFESVTWEQVVKIFDASAIALVREREMEGPHEQALM